MESTSTMLDEKKLDEIIDSLLKSPPAERINLKESDIKKLCLQSREVLMSQPMLLELDTPIKIVGDIRGQYSDLLRIFKELGLPPKSNYLFLGNYVGRGKYDLKVICLLLALKIKYPENLFLLRGNHECRAMRRYHGFYDECKRWYNVKLWKLFSEAAFDCMPAAAIVADKIFCVHGGLSPDLQKLEQIKELKRLPSVPDTGLLCDLLWSGPDRDVDAWGGNEEGMSYKFGEKIVENFLSKFDFDLICCGRQVVGDGYKFLFRRQIVTIFSAPNYRDGVDNNGAVMEVDESLNCKFKIFMPQVTDVRNTLFKQ